MLKSYIKSERGMPQLFIDAEPSTAMAYTTYFEERSCYKDFIAAGYKIFFVNLSMTALPINNTTAFTPFRVGVFEDKESEDYSEFENAVRNILSECSDAVIFPRIYISMPKWWVESHPDDVVLTANAGYREILFSDAFRRDGKDMLLRIIKHIKASDYSSRIGGWQITGGLTQEWFHHDYHGSLCNGARAPFQKWVKENYGLDGVELPIGEEYEYKGESYLTSRSARLYSLFCNAAVAESVDYFASVIKEETDYQQVVGSFYGYAYQSNGTPLFGTHGVRLLLDSPHLDFFSSPNAYTLNRVFGIDWADMIPVDSFKHHGKLSFIECDIRTYLTDAVQKARPGEYPDGIYRTEDGKSVWAGPPTPELSRNALRKCFAHQLTKGSAIWWFDMWGGWYRDEMLMKELALMKEVYDHKESRNVPRAEIVFFADECAYANFFINSPEIMGIESSRVAMGNIGAPYDMFLVEDAEKVLKGYTAAVFPFPIPSETGQTAIELCKKFKIPYLVATPEHPRLDVEEIHDFAVRSGVHIYSNEPDVIYAGNGYLALHSACGGEKEITLKEKFKITPLLSTKADMVISSTVKFRIEDNETAIFELTPVN